MSISQASRPVRFAGRILFAALLFAVAACFAVQETTDELLQRAYEIKTANNGQFQALLQQLDTRAGQLTTLQRDYLDYLKAWQLGYLGDYEAAVSALQAVLLRTQDPTLRARERISLLNDQTNAAQYEGAYANLSELLDSLPQINDRVTHHLSLAIAALLYNQAGQYDLATNYIDQALAYDNSDRSNCISKLQKAETLYKTGKLQAGDAQIREGLDACQRIGDSVYTNVLRGWLAQAQVDHGDVIGALQLLKAHDAEVQATNSSALNSQFRATLARCFLLAGDAAKAKEYARSAIEYANKQVNSKASADAWQVLYLVAKQQGDDRAALDYHEKYAAADKGYLTDTGARALAYQMVHQQVLDKKRQIDALNDSNQMLQLKEEVNAKSAETDRLYILLLICVLGSIAWWAYRTKRSQLRFQKLARRDSLTGIFNRQHFLDVAGAALQYGAKSAREACLIIIDLDNFKTVNDTHGHAAGDQVLKRAVSICQENLRSVDVFGRLGGEEFGILLPDCALQAAGSRAEELRAAISGLCSSDGDVDFPVSASFGVASTATSGFDLGQLLVDADGALYQAKHEGRNRVALFRGVQTSSPRAASAASRQ